MPEIGLEQYPNSSLDGLPLPFDVGHLYGMVRGDVLVAANAGFTIPNPDSLTLIALIFTTVRTMISFDGSSPDLADETWSEDHTFGVKGGGHKILLPAYTLRWMSEDGVNEGRILIQVYRAWKGAGVEAMKQSY